MNILTRREFMFGKFLKGIPSGENIVEATTLSVLLYTAIRSLKSRTFFTVKVKSESNITGSSELESTSPEFIRLQETFASFSGGLVGLANALDNNYHPLRSYQSLETGTECSGTGSKRVCVPVTKLVTKYHHVWELPKVFSDLGWNDDSKVDNFKSRLPKMQGLNDFTEKFLANIKSIFNRKEKKNMWGYNTSQTVISIIVGIAYANSEEVMEAMNFIEDSDFRATRRAFLKIPFVLSSLWANEKMDANLFDQNKTVESRVIENSRREIERVTAMNPDQLDIEFFGIRFADYLFLANEVKTNCETLLNAAIASNDSYALQIKSDLETVILGANKFLQTYGNQSTFLNTESGYKIIRGSIASSKISEFSEEQTQSITLQPFRAALVYIGALALSLPVVQWLTDL